jgi:hypothetical protein
MPTFYLSHTRTCAASSSSGGGSSGALVQPGSSFRAFEAQWLSFAFLFGALALLIVLAVSIRDAWPFISAWASNSAELRFAVLSFMVGAALVRDSTRNSGSESNMNYHYDRDNDYGRSERMLLLPRE